MNKTVLFCLYLLMINLVSFMMYGADKRKAEKGKWRTPESTLLLLAFLGGGPGALLAMNVFHHKTLKWKFRILVPLFTLLTVILFIYILVKNPFA